MKKLSFKKSTWFGLFILLFPLLVIAQEQTTPQIDSVCVQKELGDALRVLLKKPEKIKEEKSGSLLLVPIIGSNPATGFMLGVGGQYAFRTPGSTLYSFFSGSAQVTTKGQALFLLKNNIYTKDEKILFSGDWRFQFFSQSTYGLGTNSPLGGILDYQYSLGGNETSSDSLVQPMKFNFIRLHQSMSFKLRKSFYLGFGYHLDGYSKIEDEKLRLVVGDSLITSHFAYNTFYGFDTKKYFSSALNVNVIFDTRDNMINPYKGVFAMISWNGSREFLGSQKSGDFYQIEWRSFHKLPGKNPRHLMAFWVLGNFTPEGEFPYMVLPATAYDQRGRSARGYTQGRYRGNNYLYGEAEYRFPISQCGGIWGGVLFVNATTASNPTQELKLMESIKPGYGVGFRLMVDKKSRTNLAIDFGFGDKSSGFYLAASETF